LELVELGENSKKFVPWLFCLLKEKFDVLVLIISFSFMSESFAIFCFSFKILRIVFSWLNSICL
jgi:hypothetical protein